MKKNIALFIFTLALGSLANANNDHIPDPPPWDNWNPPPIPDPAPEPTPKQFAATKIWKYLNGKELNCVVPVAMSNESVELHFKTSFQLETRPWTNRKYRQNITAKSSGGSEVLSVAFEGIYASMQRADDVVADRHDRMDPHLSRDLDFLTTSTKVSSKALAAKSVKVQEVFALRNGKVYLAQVKIFQARSFGRVTLIGDSGLLPEGRCVLR